MTTTLPVPVRFELPSDRWAPVPPESRGVQNAAFLAVREVPAGDYQPTITISGGVRTDRASLEQIAEESLAKLRGQAGEVELVKRRLLGSEQAPAVLQTLGCVVAHEGRHYDLRQLQVLRGLVDVHDPTKRAVLIYTLTCTYAQYEPVGAEFQQFLASVEVVPGEDVRAAGDDRPS